MAEKPNEIANITLLSKPELKVWLQERAEKNRRSLNAEANLILEAAHAADLATQPA